MKMINVLCIGHGPAVFFDKISFLKDNNCNVRYIYSARKQELEGKGAMGVHPNTSYKKWIGREIEWSECVSHNSIEKLLFHFSNYFKPPYQYSKLIIWPFGKFISAFNLAIYYLTLNTADTSFSLRYALRIKREAKKHNSDVLLVRMEDLPCAAFANRPILYFPTGTRQVWQSLHSKLFKPLIFSWITNYCLRNKIDKILVNYEPCYWFSYGSGLGFKRVIPWAVMLNREDYYLNYSPSLSSTASKTEPNTKFEEAVKKYDLIFFLPGRKDMKFRNFPQKVLDAYQKFYGGSTKKILLLSLLRGEDAGEYEKQTTQMPDFNVSCLNIKGSLNRTELWNLFNQKNIVVFDQFPDIAYSVLGGVTCEAMLNGAPVVSNIAIEGDLFHLSYPPDCPLLKSRTADEIYAAMRQLDNMDTQQLESLRQRTKTWASAAADMQMATLLREIKSTVASNTIELIK